MTEFVTSPDGVKIAYDDTGQGPAILLIHGFASDRVINWRGVGWYDTLKAAGFRVLAFDNRGHGQSDKLYDPARYDQSLRVGDALAVMDAAGVRTAHVMGYSMGGYMGVELLMTHSSRVASLILGGVGESYFAGREDSYNRIAAAMEAPSLAAISDPLGQMFRRFAEQPNKDLKALAACIRGARTVYPRPALAGVAQPVLAVCGERDEISGRPGPLAAAFPNGRAVTVERRDHNTTVGDKVYKQAVSDFLTQQE